MSETELRQFCGMGPNDSMYFGEDPDLEEEDDKASRTSQRSGATMFAEGGNPFRKIDHQVPRKVHLTAMHQNARARI